MKQPERIPKELAKTFQPWDPGVISHQDFLQLEVDLVVLCKELSKLVNFSGNIGNQLRAFRLSVQEQELLPGGGLK